MFNLDNWGIQNEKSLNMSLKGLIRLMQATLYFMKSVDN